MADRWRAVYERNVRKVINAYTKDAISAIKAGVDPTTQAWQNRLERSLFNAQYGAQSMMVANGYDIAGGQFGKAQVFTMDDFANPDFNFAVIPGLEQAVYDHVLSVSKSITATQAKNIDKAINRARSFLDDDGRGLSLTDIVKSVASAMKTQDLARAKMIARTETMWSYNEGSVMQYKSVGFNELRWFATNDDVLCEHCVAMDGQIVQQGESFVSAQFGTVAHPPLHVNCRCVCIPVVDNRDRQEAVEDGRKLRAEFEERKRAEEEAKRARELQNIEDRKRARNE